MESASGSFVVNLGSSGGPPPPKTDTASLAAYVPSTCQNAGTFLGLIVGPCCCVFLVVPLAVLLPLYLLAESGYDARSGYLYGMVVLLALGLFVMLFSLRKTLGGGVCCMPPAPERYVRLWCLLPLCVWSYHDTTHSDTP